MTNAIFVLFKGKQHSAEPERQGVVEHHHQGFVAPWGHFGGGRLLSLSLHPVHPQRRDAGCQAV